MIKQISGHMNKLNVLAVMSIIGYTIAAPLAGLITLIAYSEQLQIFLMDLSMVESFVFLIACGTPLMAAALIPSFGFAGVAGFIFEGAGASYLCVTLGVFLATYLGIVLTKKVSKNSVEAIMRQKPKWQDLYLKVLGDKGVSQNWFLFMLRISPHMPFALTNLLVSQSKSSTFRLALVSTLGLLPRSFIAVLVGSKLVLISEIFKYKDNLGLAVFISLLVAYVLIVKIVKIKKGWVENPPS